MARFSGAARSLSGLLSYLGIRERSQPHSAVAAPFSTPGDSTPRPDFASTCVPCHTGATSLAPCPGCQRPAPLLYGEHVCADCRKSRVREGAWTIELELPYVAPSGAIWAASHDDFDGESPACITGPTLAGVISEIREWEAELEDAAHLATLTGACGLCGAPCKPDDVHCVSCHCAEMDRVTDELEQIADDRRYRGIEAAELVRRHLWNHREAS